MGLGIFLMRRIIDYARSRGIREIWADVLHDNTTMPTLCDALGFRRGRSADPSVITVVLDL